MEDDIDQQLHKDIADFPNPAPITQLSEGDVRDLLRHYDACYWMLASDLSKKSGITGFLKKVLLKLIGGNRIASEHFNHGELFVIKDVLTKIGQKTVMNELEQKTHQTLNRHQTSKI